jgi:curved DNA-binding protein CbpA
MSEIFLNRDEKMNLYELLEIEQNSSIDDIKKAWKKLALKYHPDKNNNSSSENFLKIKNAYDILSNDELRKEYDKKIRFNNIFNTKFNNGFNIFDINLKKYLSNFIDSTDIDIIIKLILHKKEIMNNFMNITNGFCKNFNDFISKLTDIEIILDFDLKDIWECTPKNIKYTRCTTIEFEELIIPIDFIQVYENEGEQIIINNVKYKGNLTIKINIINTHYSGEYYYVYDNDLYVLIDKKRIANNKFILNFLDGNKYKFNITKLNKMINKLGNVYYKKNFGLPKFIINYEKNYINTNISMIEIEKNIQYGNLFFIIILY